LVKMRMPGKPNGSAFFVLSEYSMLRAAFIRPARVRFWPAFESSCTTFHAFDTP